MTRSNGWNRLLGVTVLVGLLGGTCLAGAGQTLPDLSGVWVFAQVIGDTVSLPFIGERARSTVNTLRTVIIQDGESLTALERSCSTRVDYGTNLVQTTIPPEFLESMGVHERSGSVSWGQRNGTAVVEIVFPWDVQVAGAALDDLENDPLPAKPDDPRVVDQDEDGHPGVTVHVSIFGLMKGDIYVAQRNRTRLVGTLVAPDTIRGTIEWTAEQTVLGASASWLTQDQLGIPDFDRSFFIARRISPGLDCSQIEALDLFTPLGLGSPSPSSVGP